ncbi:hypothetical protein [Aeromonas cavernicola]|uniref:DUF3108 domain-containing protein n=1 Tax=Aeromonas cavernicola TaxID=1006623 RepID=A0A2H9U6C7_9GAMM|nr:hypothetical protein [Aeromonas cavernicola]PJG59552.1 hypothetical protein CUC53_06865 [Aeromonas cavernicola]
MIRPQLWLWLLSALLVMELHAAPTPPDLAARIHYVDSVTGSDGVVKQQEWREKWLRVGAQVWSQRLIPIVLARAYHAAHDAKPGHKHFTHQMAARWVTHSEAGEVQLRYADQWHRQLVEVPAEEYGQVAFTPDWQRIRYLINPALLQQMTPLDEAAPAGARWYQQQAGKQRTRVLWSDQWQIPLVVESASLDGYRSYRMTVTLQAQPSELPWLQLTDYQTLDLRDFFD